MGNFKSDRVLLKAGVPQGLMLSPLLFNLFVNDISTKLTSCKIYQYADDTLLVSSHVNYHQAVRALQHDATRVTDWFYENFITVNASKTRLVCFRNPLKQVNLDESLVLHRSNCQDCTCAPLKYVETVKYSGIFFYSDLSWTTHLSHVSGKLRSVSCLLYNTKIFMPFAVRKSIAHALAYSILRYGITSFGNCTEAWKTKIDRILKSLLKSVGYHFDLLLGADIFEALQLPNFRALHLQCVVISHFWCNDFKNPLVSSRDLRSSDRFITPRCYTRYGKRVRSYYVPYVFNRLPDSFFKATTKRKLKKLLNNFSV